MVMYRDMGFVDLGDCSDGVMDMEMGSQYTPLVRIEYLRRSWIIG